MLPRASLSSARIRPRGQEPASTVRTSSCFLSLIVLCETVWVLESSYRYPKKRIVEALNSLLMVEVFRVEEVDAAWCAPRAWAAGKADFADHLIAELGRRAGRTEIVTFDRAASSIPGFSYLAWRQAPCRDRATSSRAFPSR